MDSRMRQDLDNYITGHWGEDSVIPDEDINNQGDEPKNLTFTFNTSTLNRYEADKLLEFLNHLLNDDMHLETIVSYTINENELKSERGAMGILTDYDFCDEDENDEPQKQPPDL